jgi:hypothetical protein
LFGKETEKQEAMKYQYGRNALPAMWFFVFCVIVNKKPVPSQKQRSTTRNAINRSAPL